MGACSFITIGNGATAREAFEDAKARASCEGASDAEGYSGTIYEKRDFVMFTLPKGENAAEYASELMESDHRVSEKRGPAGCIKLEPVGVNHPSEWLFFGYSPS